MNANIALLVEVSKVLFRFIVSFSLYFLVIYCIINLFINCKYKLDGKKSPETKKENYYKEQYLKLLKKLKQKHFHNIAVIMITVTIIVLVAFCVLVFIFVNQQQNVIIKLGDDLLVN